MTRVTGLAAAAVVLVGCAPSPPQPAASFQVQPVVRGYPAGAATAEAAGRTPSLPWPKFQPGLASRASEAELAIILRGHELRDRHPNATPAELGEMLTRDGVWDRNARYVQSERRAAVAREALVPW